jgi:mannose-6-phosphate isomerase-like protein (cupin superfamily)
MGHSLPPVTIIHGSDIQEQDVIPGEIIQAPYTSGMAILGDTPVAISTPDSEEGARRGLPVHEAVLVRRKTIGHGGGEAWHTHMSYYDIFFYILSGKATMIWEQDGERREEEFGPGDFVHMSPGSTHQWLNTGDEDLKLVEFGHFHNYAGQA